MKKWSKWYKIIFASVLMMLVQNYAHAHQGVAFQQSDSVFISLPDTAIFLGDELLFGIKLQGSSIDSINSIQFGFRYDTTKLSLISFIPSQEVTQNFNYFVNDSIPGHIYFAAASAESSLGDEIVVDIKFMPNSIGTTKLEIEELLLNEGKPKASVLGGSIIIEEDPDIIRPKVPLQLKGKLINAETINLEWNNFASIGFIGYQIYQLAGPLPNDITQEQLQRPWQIEGVERLDTLLRSIDIPKNSTVKFDVSGLESLEYYTFWVTGLDQNEIESYAENIRQRTGDLVSPEKPPNVTSVLEDQKITLNWNASPSLDVENYAIYRNRVDIFEELTTIPNTPNTKISTKLGEIEFMVLFAWEPDKQRHKILINKSVLPDGISPTEINQLQLYDLYDDYMSFESEDNSWVTYYIYSEINGLSIQSSQYIQAFRSSNDLYVISATLEFNQANDSEPFFKLLDVLSADQLSFIDTDIDSLSLIRYSYKIAAIDSSEGDLFENFDPANRSEFSDIAIIETPPVTWTVDLNGEGDFETVQETIYNSRPFDHIVIRDGIYRESIELTHPVSIHGQGDVKFIKPETSDVILDVNAKRYNDSKWPNKQSLSIQNVKFLGSEEPNELGTGIRLDYGTSVKINKSHFAHFDNVINANHSSFSISNSILSNNRTISYHRSHLYAGTSQKDTVRFVHVNVLNTREAITDLEGGISLAFVNSILVDKIDLKNSEDKFVGLGVSFFNVALDTNKIRSNHDIIEKLSDDVQNTEHSRVIHFNNIDQVLFQSQTHNEDLSNYRLQSESKVIGSGNRVENITDDFLGQKRVSDKVDLGAIEHPNDTPVLFPSPEISVTRIDTTFSDNLKSAVEIEIKYPDSLSLYLDAIYLSKWSVENELIRIDTLNRGSFIDFDTYIGNTYKYSAQAKLHDLYLGKTSERETIFIEELSPPVDIIPPIPANYLTAKRLNARTFELEWEVDAFDELSHFNIYKVISIKGLVEAFEDTIDTTWLWTGGEFPLDALYANSIELFDSLIVPQGLFEQAQNDSSDLIFNWVDNKDLLNQTVYTYWVTSVDLAGNEGDARFIVIQTGDDTPPNPPINIIQTIQDDQLILEWDPSPEKDVEWYKIYKGLDSTSVSLYDSINVDIRTFIDTIDDLSVQVFYRISAVDSAISNPIYSFDPALEGELSKSTLGYNIDLTGPSKPIIESVYSANSLVQIDWATVLDPDLDYYNIYRGSHPDTVEIIDNTDALDSFYSDSTVKNGILYYYFISGVDTSSNEGELSDIVLGTPFNIPPSVAAYDDIYIHDQERDQFGLSFTFQGFDNDGEIDSTLWIVDNELYSIDRVPSIDIKQGSTHITLVAIDNDGGRDSSSFSVYMDAGFIDLGANLLPTSGLSLFGNNFSFQPDGRGNLSLMTPEESNEFRLIAPLQAPVAIATDSTFYLISGTQKLNKYSLFNWWKHKITLPYWSTSTGGVHSSSPVIDEKRKRLYLVSEDNQIFGIDVREGIQQWRSNIGAPGIHPGVILSERFLAQPNKLGDITYFDLDASISFKEMSPLGKTVFGEGLMGALSVTNNSELVAAFSSGTIRKWNPNLSSESTDQILWETNLATTFQTTPVIAENGLILVGGADSTFYGINGANGQVEWTFRAFGSITSTASINEYGVIYFGDASGRVYAVDDAGNLIWDYQIQTGDETSSLSVMNTINYVNGSVFVATQGGKLVSIRDGWRYDGSLEKKFGSEWDKKQAQWATYQGNYRRSGNVDMSFSTSSESFESIPTEFQLLQNYPNPFNPSTQIEFAIPEASEVRLEVFNTLGQKVRTLKDAHLPAGYYSIRFDATSFPSGVYYYRLTAGSFTELKNMLLIK